MTRPVDVVWWEGARGFWDQGWLEAFLTGDLWHTLPERTWRHHNDVSTVEGDTAVFVIPARWHVTNVDAVNAAINQVDNVLVVLTGDEEGAFPWRDLTHPHMAVAVQTPYPDRHGDVDLVVGDYWPPECRPHLPAFRNLAASRPLPWFFAGQLNNSRRHECVRVLRGLDHHHRQLLTTDTFGDGLTYPAYMARMAAAKVVPCPSGSFTPDSFRLFEALEAGCVPVVDDAAQETGPVGYWPFLFGGDPPFPVVTSWDEFPAVLARILADWPASANRVFAWWQQQKRTLGWRLHDILERLRAPAVPATVDALVTVLMPTSPIPSHPGTAIIDRTLASVRARLPHAEVLVMVDGVRPEQEHRRAGYDEYVRRLLWQANHDWSNVLPVVFDTHQHQANMTRRALELVRTPLVLFVEHDTPLVGDIPFDRLALAVLSGDANVIRLHHESRVLDDHRHLMLDSTPQPVAGTPLLRTVQWSQRPHLAATSFYHRLLADHFPPACRTMIEDRAYGLLEGDWRTRGEAGWDRWRLWMYAPEGDMRRSDHLDGRGSDPKYDMDFGLQAVPA